MDDPGDPGDPGDHGDHSDHSDHGDTQRRRSFGEGNHKSITGRTMTSPAFLITGLTMTLNGSNLNSRGAMNHFLKELGYGAESHDLLVAMEQWTILSPESSTIAEEMSAMHEQIMTVLRRVRNVNGWDSVLRLTKCGLPPHLAGLVVLYSILESIDIQFSARRAEVVGVCLKLFSEVDSHHTFEALADQLRLPNHVSATNTCPMIVEAFRVVLEEWVAQLLYGDLKFVGIAAQLHLAAQVVRNNARDVSQPSQCDEQTRDLDFEQKSVGPFALIDTQAFIDNCQSDLARRAVALVYATMHAASRLSQLADADTLSLPSLAADAPFVPMMAVAAMHLSRAIAARALHGRSHRAREFTCTKFKIVGPSAIDKLPERYLQQLLDPRWIGTVLHVFGGNEYQQQPMMGLLCELVVGGVEYSRVILPTHGLDMVLTLKQRRKIMRVVQRNA
jgi:hypothetical protein